MTEESRIFRKGEVQGILKALKEGRINTIEPTFSFEAGIEYPELRKVTSLSEGAIQQTLEELSKVGVLVPEVVGNLAVCPHCGSHKLSMQLQCPTCGLQKLSRGPMIEHMTCGHLDVEENYRKGEGLVCPKCGRALKAVGVDYRRLGMLYRCMGCGSFFPNPRARFSCSNGHSFEEGELAIKELVAYRLNPEKRGLIEKVTLDLKAAMKALIDKGWYGEAPAVLVGKTGVEHEVSFALWRDGNDRGRKTPDIIGEVYIGDEKTTSYNTLAYSAIAADIGAGESIIASVPGLDGKGKLLAKSFNIHVVEAETPSELQRKIEETLQTIVTRKEKEMLKAEVEALEKILKEIEGGTS